MTASGKVKQMPSARKQPAQIILDAVDRSMPLPASLRVIGVCKAHLEPYFKEGESAHSAEAAAPRLAEPDLSGLINLGAIEKSVREDSDANIPRSQITIQGDLRFQGG